MKKSFMLKLRATAKEHAPNGLKKKIKMMIGKRRTMIIGHNLISAHQ